MKKEMEKRESEQLCEMNDCHCPKEPTNVISDLPLIEDINKMSMEEIKKNMEHLIERIECVVCKIKKREIIFEPCSHLVVCRVCSPKIGNDCPICRLTIRDRTLVFFS